jgi:hypothetical protein
MMTKTLTQIIASPAFASSRSQRECGDTAHDHVAEAFALPVHGSQLCAVLWREPKRIGVEPRAEQSGDALRRLAVVVARKGEP